MALEEADHPARPHQLGLVQVEIQPVDRLQLEDDMLVENIGDAAG